MRSLAAMTHLAQFHLKMHFIHGLDDPLPDKLHIQVSRTRFTIFGFQEATAAKQLSQVEGQQQQQQQQSTEVEAGSTHVSFRLVIQSSQCGSLIGKGGSKIKEIREVRVCTTVQ